MKISDERKNHLVRFDSICTGSVFHFGECFYIKTHPIRQDEFLVVTAIELDDGSEAYFDDDTLVISVDATLKIADMEV